MNLIANITSDQAIRNAISSEVGEDLLGLMDALRVNNSTAFSRVFPTTTEIPDPMRKNWPMEEIRIFARSRLAMLTSMAT